MTFVTVSNLVLVALCIAVIVQSLRMSKGIREIRSSSLNEGVEHLDAATARAQAVLLELKSVLAAASAAQNRAMANGEALREELSVVVGIGNAVAERIIEAAAAQNEKKAEETAPAEKNRPARAPGQPKTRSGTRSSRRKAAKAPAEGNANGSTATVAGHA